MAHPDLDGRVASWNSGAVRLKGYSAEEIIGQSFTRFYTPEDLQAGVPQKAFGWHVKLDALKRKVGDVRKDGSRFWASVVIDAVRDQHGKTIGFAKVTRDVTERQRAHQALVESEASYRRLIEGVTDYAIFQLDPDGLVTTWNPGAQRIKGYTRTK